MRVEVEPVGLGRAGSLDAGGSTRWDLPSVLSRSGVRFPAPSKNPARNTKVDPNGRNGHLVMKDLIDSFSRTC